MKSLCGAECANCQWNSTCPGCSDEKCFIAKYIKKDGKEAYEEFKQTLIGEFNALAIPGMPKVNELYALVGEYVNLEYPMPSGGTVKFLDDNSMYKMVRYAILMGRIDRKTNMHDFFSSMSL